MKFEIKNHWSGELIFSLETESLRLCVVAAVKQGISLSDANLSDANLSDADLRGANLSDANLSDANLSDADLRGANLSDANLSDANLRDADLSDADLSDADLRGANLSDANLSDANLRDADLSDADLQPIRDDFWAVLSAAPAEVEGLRAAIVAGKIYGSTYTGACACLVGTIANVAKLSHTDLPVLKPQGGRPIERFFLNINKGDTPETNSVSKIVLEWLDQWLGAMKAAFGRGVL